MGRLSIDVSDKEHQQIKLMATLHGKTIREYAREMLLQPLAVNDAAAWQEFSAMAKERILEADSDEVSTISFDEIFALAQRNISQI